MDTNHNEKPSEISIWILIKMDTKQNRNMAQRKIAISNNLQQKIQKSHRKIVKHNP